MVVFGGFKAGQTPVLLGFMPRPDLAKVGVEGSNPFARSNFLPSAGKANGPSMGPLSNLNGSAAYQGQDG